MAWTNQVRWPLTPQITHMQFYYYRNRGFLHLYFSSFVALSRLSRLFLPPSSLFSSVLLFSHTTAQNMRVLPRKSCDNCRESQTRVNWYLADKDCVCDSFNLYSQIRMRPFWFDKCFIVCIVVFEFVDFWSGDLCVVRLLFSQSSGDQCFIRFRLSYFNFIHLNLAKCKSNF